MKQTLSVLKLSDKRIFDEKYILSFSILATIFNFFYCPFSFFILHTTLGAAINGASSVFLAVVIFLRKRNLIGRTLAENFLLGIAFTTLFALSYRSGGLTSAIVPWYIVINMFSLTVNNKKVAIFWTMMALLSMMYFWIAESFYGVDFPNDYSGHHFNTWFFFVIIGVFFLGIKIVGLIEDRNKEFINTLTEKNEELNKSHEEILKLQKYKENFLANITHELRTPLNAIKSISELLKMEITEHEKTEMIEGLNQSSNHLLNMINDILDFSKLKEGKLILRHQVFELEETIKAACRLMKINANDKGLAFVLDINSTLPKSVYGDDSRLIQILVNIIGNSIKFTQNGSIKVECSAELIDAKHSTIRIKITDTGIGISNEKIKLIFDDYVQADENIAAQFGGTGLGLGITKRLIELHHGTINCESELGKGTSFTIYLPFEIALIESNANSLENFDLIEQSNIKILLADDNKMNLFVAEKLIEKSLPLAQIYKVENGIEAIDFLSKNKIDIVLMDMKMPLMDGPTATIEIRKNQHFKDLQIIAMTAATSDDEINECLQSGMNDYISKPFHKNELLKKIQKAFINSSTQNLILSN